MQHIHTFARYPSVASGAFSPSHYPRVSQSKRDTGMYSGSRSKTTTNGLLIRLGTVLFFPCRKDILCTKPTPQYLSTILNFLIKDKFTVLDFLTDFSPEDSCGTI